MKGVHANKKSIKSNANAYALPNQKWERWWIKSYDKQRASNEFEGHSRRDADSICICQLQNSNWIFTFSIAALITNLRIKKMFFHTQTPPWAIYVDDSAVRHRPAEAVSNNQRLQVKFKFSFDYLPILKPLNCTTS